MAPDSTNEKVATIQAFFDAYANNDRSALDAVMADNITWTIPGHHPLADRQARLTHCAAPVLLCSQQHRPSRSVPRLATSLACCT